MKVLIIEDDDSIARRLADHLQLSGFVAHREADGVEAHFAGTSLEYDAVLLDLGLPGLDGTELLRRWRAEGISTPVVVLTARSGKHDIVNALEAGADDYVTKPFDLDEVVARLRATIRRQNSQSVNKLYCGDVSVDMTLGRVMVCNDVVSLTRTEYLFVQYLFLNQGQTISISELADHVYDDYDHGSSIVPRHIANIRKKIGRDTIRTVSNRGYSVPVNESNESDEPD